MDVGMKLEYTTVVSTGGIVSSLVRDIFFWYWTKDSVFLLDTSFVSKKDSSIVRLNSDAYFLLNILII